MDLRSLLDHPMLYSAWQFPFVAQKVAPFLAVHDPMRTGRVLEIGCGPGTNASLFRQCDYVGVDLNPRYITTARKKHRGTFIQGDATSFVLEDSQPFDLVFCNSLFHHLDDAAVERTLARAASLLKPSGELHLLDLVLPDQPSVARFLARADRGDYPRSLSAWQALLSQHFVQDAFTPYPVKFLSITCWQMMYFRGRPL
ncbi:class I SAM-dependent methyltransferase [Planctopirus ephydatiae]|uniref:class I SAM-dependent methyltransferase n=1 Tax=Planctopirus ephydatiae TaxID=2528019 RepID=UPI0011AA9F80